MPPADIHFTQAIKEINAYRRKKRQQTDEIENIAGPDSALLDSFGHCLGPIAAQLKSYSHHLADTSSLHTLEAGGESLADDDTAAVVNPTRVSLRLAAMFLATIAAELAAPTALSSPALLTVEVFLNDASRLWTDYVTCILACADGDAKCRLYAARLYSNLITLCYATLELGSFLLPSVERKKSQEYVSADDSTAAYTWLDFVQSVMGERGCHVETEGDNRAALAAIIAALYNAAMASERMSNDDSEKSDVLSREIALSSMILQALLGQLKRMPVDSDSAAKTEIDRNDAANEWILMLFGRLVETGHLQTIYHALGRSSNRLVQTEHDRLLDCMVHSQVKIFGRNEDETNRSLLFLVTEYCRLAEPLPLASVDDQSNDLVLIMLAVKCKLLEILGDYLGSEGPRIDDLRLIIGQDTPLVSIAGKELAVLVDTLFERNSDAGVKKITARNLSMSLNEQHFITGLVQLLGNLAYRCAPNQDLLRTTVVSSLASCNELQRRNILHVLLSCTSFAWACFTLREWALVAIRNALEDNDSNQAVIAELQAQEAVQSASLTDMGIRVDLTNAGKVSVHPLDDHR